MHSFQFIHPIFFFLSMVTKTILPHGVESKPQRVFAKNKIEQGFSAPSLVYFTGQFFIMMCSDYENQGLTDGFLKPCTHSDWF